MTFGRGGREGRESVKQKERKRKEQLEEKFRRKLFRDDERGMEDERVPGQQGEGCRLFAIGDTGVG